MLMLYENPVALDRERHRNMRLQRRQPLFHFARNTNSVPLAGVEFAQAACHYPIIFAGADEGKAFPAVLLGLQDDQNLYVDAEGAWHANYIPAYVRRYPFVLATPDGAASDNYTVCIDEAFEGLTQGGHGEDLFEESGDPAPFLQRAMSFLTDYQQNLGVTEQFSEKLQELNLLTERSINVVSAGGRQLSISGVYLIDEEKLADLDDATVVELYRTGYLGWIFAHIVSLNRIQDLGERFSARYEGEGAVQKPEMSSGGGRQSEVDTKETTKSKKMNGHATSSEKANVPAGSSEGESKAD